MKKYSIWSEGYVVTGNSSGAIYHGESEGNSFKEAVENLCKKEKGFSAYVNLEKLTYWGCKLYDNESDARKTFG